MRLKLFRSCLEARETYRAFDFTESGYDTDALEERAELRGKFCALFDLICELGLEETYYEWQLAEEEKVSKAQVDA